MNVHKVIVVLVVILCPLTQTCGAARATAGPPLSGFGFEMLLARLEHLYEKMAELEDGIQKDRENTDTKLNGIFSLMNQTISQHTITLQSQSNIAMRMIQETSDQKLAKVIGAIDRMSERMDHNLTSVQTQFNVAISKEREVTDAMLSTITEDINKLSGMTNQKLSEVASQFSQTIDQKLSGVVNRLGHNITALHGNSNTGMEERLQTHLNSAIKTVHVLIERKFNDATTAIDELEQMIVDKLNAMRVEGKEELYKHILWTNQEQMREEIEAVVSMEDLAQLKNKYLPHLRHISFKSCKENPSKTGGKYILQRNTYLDIFLGTCIPLYDGENWLQIQARSDGSVNFTRGWKDYRDGFGSFNNEHWIGLELLHKLTTARPHELFVYLKDFNGNSKYARYSAFEIGSESECYALKKLGSYSGTAGDSLTAHEGMKFSTYDRDNDISKGSCASAWKGGWWYKDCYYANLNGVYKKGEDKEANNWYAFSSSFTGLSYSKMFIREI